MLFQSHEGQFEPSVLEWARHVHGCVFGEMSLVWERKGTWIEAWKVGRRVAFAPHQGGASIDFQRHEPVAENLDWGGQCKTGKMTIHVPVGAELEGVMLRILVSGYLGLPRGLTGAESGPRKPGRGHQETSGSTIL